MPELPEVETVCRGLAPHVEGQMITEAKLFSPKIRFEVPKNIAKILKAKRIEKVIRKAKYILLELDSEDILVVHLGMTGRFTIDNENTEEIFKNKIKHKAKHDHLMIELENGSTLTFNDARRFGVLDLTTKEDISSFKLFSKLGLEPLSKEFNPESLYTITKRRTKNIKAVIMDSSLIVGVGNIYASESLFKAGIHPEKEASKISKKKITLLYKAIVETLERAIEAGGSTLKDYANADGNAGYFQHEFLVYDQDGQPCTKCKTKIERIKQNGRSTYYCSKCQI